MDSAELKRSLRAALHRYRFGLLVLVLGLTLMWLPGPQQREALRTEPVPDRAEDSLECRLEAILSAVDGAGEVRVLLTEKTGPVTHYQSNRRTDSDGTGKTEQQDIVVLEDERRSQYGLVLRRDPPQYRGALIACRGADRAQVRLALVRAVQCVTGLRSDQIQVVRMK